MTLSDRVSVKMCSLKRHTHKGYLSFHSQSTILQKSVTPDTRQMLPSPVKELTTVK